MLRVLRYLVFVAFFTLLMIGALGIYDMVQEGAFWEPYNRTRRVNIVWTCVGILGVGAMTYLEIRLTMISRKEVHQELFRLKHLPQAPARADSSSIYTAPPTSKVWDGNSIYRESSRRNKRSRRR